MGLNNDMAKNKAFIKSVKCTAPSTLSHGLSVIIYFVGKYIEADERFEIQGIFTTKAKAINSCRDRTYFVLPIILDKLYPDRTIISKKAFYPKS